MSVHPLEVRNGHLLVARDGGIDLLDTGSPLTMPAPSVVHEHVGPDVTRLVGTDLMAGEVIEIDFAAKTVTFGAMPGPAVPWIEVRSLFGVPCLTIGTPWGDQEAILDTGATLNLGPAEQMEGIEVVGTVTDFLPTGTTLETQVRTLELSIGGRSVTVRVGELPEEVGGLLGAFGGPQWIIGTSLFVGRRLLLDLGANRIADFPGGPQ